MYPMPPHQNLSYSKKLSERRVKTETIEHFTTVIMMMGCNMFRVSAEDHKKRDKIYKEAVEYTKSFVDECIENKCYDETTKKRIQPPA